MNKKVWSLTKVFLKNSFQNTGSKKKTNTKAKSIGMIILYALLFLYVAGIMGSLSFGMIQSLLEIHQEQVFLGVFFLAIAFLLIFQAIFSGMNVLYFSKDVEYVLPLPLKPREIVMAKLNTILITEYGTELLFGAIPLILYGILTGAGAIYYLMTIAVLLVFPILPILIALLLIMVVMTFSRFTRNREKFQAISTMLIVAIVMIFSFSMSSTNQMSDEQLAQSLVQANGMVEQLGGYFITIQPAIKAITNPSILSAIFEFAKILLITIIGYVIFLAIGQKIYLRGAVGSSSSSNRKKKEKVPLEYQKQSVGLSYVKKEMKILIRNPVFFMQCVLPAILMPILMFGLTGIGLIGAPQEEVKEAIMQIQPFAYSSFAVCIVLGITVFFSMMLYTATTAFSRDGQNATFVKYIPIALYKQLYYKAVPNMLFYGIETILTLGVFWFLTRVSILFLLVLFIVAMLIGVITSIIMEFVDLKKPKLEWDTEYAVVKQNLNLMWNFLFGMVVLGILIGLTFFLPNVIVFLITILLVCVVTLFLLHRYIRKRETKLFEKIS